MKITHGTAAYTVGPVVATTPSTNIYLCEEAGAKRQRLLLISTALEHNGGLDREAYWLRELDRMSVDADVAYAAAKSDPDAKLNYGKLFPELVDSFISHEQGGRRINVLAFRGVDEVRRLVPLPNLAARDRLRVDMRTSAWIMGRLLKLLGFVHDAGISVGLLSGGNILLEPKKHYAVLFDWSAARSYPGDIPMEQRANDIAQAARAVIVALGGDSRTGIIPDTTDDLHPYSDYLVHLADHRETDAELAHHRFYDIVDDLWERKYYPFTTLPLGG